MESDLQITVKGMPEEQATMLGNAVAVAIKALEKNYAYLDLRRLHQVIVTTDFATELADLSNRTVSGKPITFTNEEYAIAVAKTFILPRGSELEILLVFNAYVASVLLLQGDLENFNEEQLYRTIHFLHHELCHVHDGNKKIDALHTVMLKQQYKGKDMLTGPLAEICWAEYIATVLSASTGSTNWIREITDSFTQALERTKTEIDKEILSYRFHADLDKLMEMFHRHGEFLPITAARTLGYMDGLEKSLVDLSPEITNHLSKSYFEPTWQAMKRALRGMYQSYPEAWKDLSIYDELSKALERYYEDMGLLLSTTDDDIAYISIPFRPETMPSNKSQRQSIRNSDV